MRLLVCTDEFPPDSGGIGTYVYEVAKGLHRLGWSVTVLAWQHIAPAEQIRAFNTQQPYQVISSPHKLTRQDIVAALQQVKPHLLLASDLNPLWVSRWAAFRHTIPIVAIGYGSELRRSPLVRRIIKKYLYQSCQHVVLISQFTVDLMHRADIYPRHTSIIYPGGDDGSHSPNVDCAFLRERYNLHGKRVLLTMGSLSERKGQDIVLHTLRHLLPRYPDLHYVMVGRDRSEGQIPALVEALGLQVAVTLTGMIPDEERAAFYNLAECCLITSRNTQADVEGYGIVVIEAALCGRTSIGTLGTGIQEAIQDGVTGLLVPQNDVPATAAALQKLLDDPTLRERLAQQALTFAQTEATWSARVRQFDQLLHSLVRS